MPDALPLIEVWSAEASAGQPGELERRCTSWLTDEERQRAMRFRKDTSRNQHIVGRGMTRKLLTDSASESFEPSQIVLSFTPHGKPFVSSPQELACPFNVAHTDSMVLFANCPRNLYPQNGVVTIGVDVERISRRTDTALAQRYFAAPEVDYVFDHRDPEHQRAAFLRVWTLKEAFIKAIGTGLTMPLGDFAFENIDSPRPRVRMLSPALGDGQQWQFLTFAPAEGFVAALAIDTSPGVGAAALRLRRFESLIGLPAAPAGSPTLPPAHRTEPTAR